MVWQPDHSRAIIKREELRQARGHDEAEGLERALDLDADEVAARAERKRLEREAAGDATEPRERTR
jgi:hypothetical protein